MKTAREAMEWVRDRYLEGHDLVDPYILAYIEGRDAEREKELKEACEFAIGAIEDAIGLEDGLDGAAGEAVLKMLRKALSPAMEKELKAPGPCGKHPKDCWIDDAVEHMSGRQEDASHCTACAETAKMQAEIAELKAHMPDPQKVEVLKVFYALFTTLMDTEDDKLLPELRILNQRLKEATETHGPVSRN